MFIKCIGSGSSGIGAAGLLEDRGASVTLYDGNDKQDADTRKGVGEGYVEADKVCQGNAKAG